MCPANGYYLSSHAQFILSKVKDTLVHSVILFCIMQLSRLRCKSFLSSPKKDSEEAEKNEDEKINNEKVHNSWLNSKDTLLFCFHIFLVVFLQTTGFFQFLIEYPFNLSVYWAKFINCPLFQSFVGIVINPYDKTFFRTHSFLILG